MCCSTKKIVVFDTVDKEISARYFDNLAALLKDKSPDFLCRAPHGARPRGLYSRVFAALSRRHNRLQRQNTSYDSGVFRAKAALNVRTVTEQDTLETGRHSFRFVFAPMVHWPEVMVSFDVTDGTLFSADAFGTFERSTEICLRTKSIL